MSAIAESRPQVIPFPSVRRRQFVSPGARQPWDASCTELMHQLERIAHVAPAAPLSFLVVDLGPNAAAAPAAVAMVHEAIGPLDLASVMEDGRIGVVLQGAGTERSARIAGRIGLRLNDAAILPPGRRAVVYAATGTGRNAAALPGAAACELPESC